MNSREELLIKVAKTIYPECIKITQDIYERISTEYPPKSEYASKMAITYADALISNIHEYSKLFSEEDRKRFLQPLK
jgi:hypothetical protein